MPDSWDEWGAEICPPVCSPRWLWRWFSPKPLSSCGMKLWMRSQGPGSRRSSCSAHRSPGLHFLGSPSLLSGLAHTLAPAWTTLLPISALSLSPFQLFVGGGNAPGQRQWLGFSASSSRKPSLIFPSPAPELKVILYF